MAECNREWLVIHPHRTAVRTDTEVPRRADLALLTDEKSPPGDVLARPVLRTRAADGHLCSLHRRRVHHTQKNGVQSAIRPSGLPVTTHAPRACSTKRGKGTARGGVPAAAWLLSAVWDLCRAAGSGGGRWPEGPPGRMALAAGR